MGQRFQPEHIALSGIPQKNSYPETFATLLPLFKFEGADGYAKVGTWDKVASPEKPVEISKKKGFGRMRRLIMDFIPSIALTYDYDKMSPAEICKLSVSGEF